MILNPSASGRPILMLHGFMGSGNDWRSIAGLIGRPVMAPDLPGHGSNVGLPAEAYTMPAVAEALADHVRAEIGDEPVDVLGYSMGGRLALYFALAHPERIRHLITESASPGLKTETERAARRVADTERAEALQRQGMETFLDAWYAMPLFASLHRHPARLDALRQIRAQSDPVELGRSLAGMGTGAQPSLWDRLGELRMPWTAIAGALDAKYVEITRNMTADLPFAHAHIVPDAGHCVHLERPVAYAQALVTDSST
ncbi:MAG: 2-succinyl-6-hydroxy-2,4-cyclohexadiene-1-carboxylate synthase [Bacteroidota bacterium]